MISSMCQEFHIDPDSYSFLFLPFVAKVWRAKSGGEKEVGASRFDVLLHFV